MKGFERSKRQEHIGWDQTFARVWEMALALLSIRTTFQQEVDMQGRELHKTLGKPNHQTKS
jgi:hypothetical protein